MAEKKKNIGSRLGTIPFAALWTMAYGLGWAILMIGGLFTSRVYPQFFYSLPDIAFFVLLTTVPAVVYNFAQQVLIRWKFAVNLRWWWLWSTAAAAIAGGSLQMLNWIDASMPIVNPMFSITLLFGYLFGLQALVQGWMLRQHIKRAWMWPMAAVASAATFAVPVVGSSFFSEAALIGSFGFAGILQGAVMALSLVWLFGMTRVEPLKRGIEDSQLEQAQEKLRERELVQDDIAHIHEAETLRQQQ